MKTADCSKITYREATEQDSFFIEEMVLDLCEELNDGYEIDEIRRDLAAMRQLPAYRCYVAVDSHPIGCAAFITAKELGKKQWCAFEAFWYVEPEYRGGVGKELLNFVEKEAESDNIEFGISNPRLEAMMERSGYSRVKSLMRKEI